MVQDSNAFQRDLTVEETAAAKEIEAEGSEVEALTAKEHNAFVCTVRPWLNNVHEIIGDEIFRLANL